MPSTSLPSRGNAAIKTSSNPISIPDFATQQISLLQAELDAEKAETTLLFTHAPPITLQRAGLAITNLLLNSQRTGLGGKTVVELGKDAAFSSPTEGLGEHGIRTGDIIRVATQPSGSSKKKEKTDLEGKGTDGVVVRVGEKAISIALGKDEVDIPEGRLWVVKLANEVTYRRMEETMKKLQDIKEGQESDIMRICFGITDPTSIDSDLLKDGAVEFIDPGLNESQKEAIRFAIAAQDVALIHGPPGTGKTHTLIELTLQLLKLNKRILVCGPSNISVDNIVERLAPHKIPIVRLGHPARLLPSVLDHSLEVLTRTSEAGSIVRDVRKEMDEKQRSIRKTRNGRERRVIYGELKELRKEYRQRENKCIDGLVRGSKVVLATLHGAGGFQLRGQQFDVVIIDEASQALEAQCWVSLLSAKKVVLAGDHLQLPPTIKSKDHPKASSKPAESKSHEKKVNENIGEKGPIIDLETTLFDRLLALHGSSIKRMLTTQYRMHEKIMRFPSDILYDSKLIAAEHVKERLLKDLPYEVEETDDTSEPIVFFDTQGDAFPEDVEDETKMLKKGAVGESKSNKGEALIVKMHVQNLVQAGVHNEDIAVITPYNAQLSLLSQKLKESFPGIELGSVDGFQGREKEAVIVSLVRSNDKHEVGFLSDKRRLNVAMTRPKRHLCIIGDSETIRQSNNEFLKKWMNFLEENAELRYPDSGDLED